jgi:hypothetical protein
MHHGRVKPLIRVAAALLVVGCSVPADLSSSSAEPETETKTPSVFASPNAPSSAASLPTASAPSDPPLPALDSRRPIDAAARLLGLPGAQVRLLVERANGTDPAEILISGQGVVDPAGRRGQMTFDFSGFFAIPGASAASPNPENAVHLLWDVNHMYVQPYGSDFGSGWAKRTRAQGQESGGLIGRLPNEVLGLVGIIADSEPAAVAQLTDTPLEGVTAEHYFDPGSARRCGRQRRASGHAPRGRGPECVWHRRHSG